MSSSLPIRTALAAAGVLLTGSLAIAQTTTSQSVTTISPAPYVAPLPLIIPPPVGTLSTTTTEQKVAPDGTKTSSESSTYRNTNGVAQDTMTRTTTVPAPATTTTRTDTTTTVTKP